MAQPDSRRVPSDAHLFSARVGQMTEPVLDQRTETIGTPFDNDTKHSSTTQPSLGDQALTHDNVFQDEARPSPALLEGLPAEVERDPLSFDKKEFDTLHPAMQDRVSLALMRQVPIRVLREGLKLGEERTQAQIELETINPTLEIEYPISLSERLEFDAWEIYITKGWASVDPDKLDIWDDVGITTLLDQERMRNKGIMLTEGGARQRQAVEGLKIGRYRRYQMQRQIEAELRVAEADKLQRVA